MTPTRHHPDDPDLGYVLSLIRTSFAYMDGRIDPPSSMHRLDLRSLSDLCVRGEVWSLGTPPAACIILTPNPDALYLGKLAVRDSDRGKGHAARLLALAAHRALALGLSALELQSRVELTEVHAYFKRHGFQVTGSTAHDGYDRPTSLTFRKYLG